MPKGEGVIKRGNFVPDRFPETAVSLATLDNGKATPQHRGDVPPQRRSRAFSKLKSNSKPRPPQLPQDNIYPS